VANGFVGPDIPYNPEPQPPPPFNGSVPPLPPQPPPGANTLPGTLGNLVPTNLIAWGMVTTYEFDFGLRSSPVAAPYRSVKRQFWRCNSGGCIKIITCIGVAAGTTNPAMPGLSTASDHNLGNDVLVYMTVVNFVPDNFMDGVQCRATRLMLYYEMQLAPDLTTDVLDLGASPFDITPAADNILTPSDFNALFNQASAVSGFTGPPITF
jgi:hypothetical protein